MQEIIINQNKEKLSVILLENGKIIEKYEETENKERIEGNIYLGIVRDVLPGMQAAFVDIGSGKNTFIHLKDAVPKIDESKYNFDEKIKDKNISDFIKSGMKILVQVKRDETAQKGARVSTHISIPTRYSVLMPNVDFITISQKIEDEQERNRLLEVAKELLPKGYGAIIRTAASKKTKEELKRDFEIAIEKWNNINNVVKQKEKNTKPEIIYKTPGLIEKFLVDVLHQDISKITVNNKGVLEKIEELIKQLDLKTKIELKENEDLLKIHDIEEQLEKLQYKKIWLKCGGYIVIEQTEALVAIDVNSGKYVGKKELEQTVYTVNKEASIEIAKQLRLRDIGGIIIIDYIDMKKDETREKIIQVLEENLKKDRSKTQILGFTKLNLLEMTRKHMVSNEM